MSPEMALAAGSWVWERRTLLHPTFRLLGERCAHLTVRTGHRDLLPFSEVVQGDAGGRGCGQANERGDIKHGSHLMAGISTGR